MRFFFACLLLTALISCKSFTQAGSGYTTYRTADPKTQKLYKKGLEYVRSGDSKKAAEHFEQLARKQDLFIDAHIQAGANNFDLGQYDAASKYFKQALSIDPEYNPLVYYKLGLALKAMGSYEEAIQYLESFIAKEKKKVKTIRKATLEIENCRLAKDTYQNPVPFKAIRLGPEINTDAWEYLPSLTADANTLIFTRRTNQEDFYISYKEDDNWTYAEPITALNTPKNEGAQSVSADGKTILFTVCQRSGDFGACDLYISEVQNGYWKKPKNLGSTVNTKYSDKQPSISANGNQIIFCSDRPGGKGGLDLWITKKSHNGWAKPQNLGEPINTVGDESSPFLHADGVSLYFSSNGHANLGKVDIFKSERADNGLWSIPENLGHPINSPAVDNNFVVTLDGTTAYMASDRGDTPNDSKGLKTTDIIEFELYAKARPKPVSYVQALVKDAETLRPLVVDVNFIKYPDNSKFLSRTTDKDGTFLVCLPASNDYGLQVSAPGYSFYSDRFSLASSQNLDAKAYQLEILLQPIKSIGPTSMTSKPVVLKNVLFETGTAELNPQSEYELNTLVDLLTEHPTLRILIGGHTDNVGSQNDNQKLSENRAMVVKEYLVDKGISAQRIEAKGFGESQAIEDNSTPQGRALNRRTEFTILHQ